MTEREKIAGRIRALLAKTVENGCTEEEALSAAALAAKLLSRYNLTVDEVELRASPFAKHRERFVDAVGERLWKPASAIATLTGATYWVSGPGVHPVEVNWFGFRHEVEISTYLVEICARAMRTENRRLTRAYALLRPAVQQLRIRPFLDGMADRLRERILAMKEPEPTGTGLVVLRTELVRAAMELAGIEIRDLKARSSRDLEAAYADGRAAADRVALNQGLAGGAPSHTALEWPARGR